VDSELGVEFNAVAEREGKEDRTGVLKYINTSISTEGKGSGGKQLGSNTSSTSQ